MKIIKTLFIVLLTFVFVLVPYGAYAQPLFSAHLSLLDDSSSGKSSQKIYLYLGDSISISLNLKTSKGYYAGSFAAQIFYSSNFFDQPSTTLNTSGRFYSSCKTYTDITPSKSITQTTKDRLYPSKWSELERNQFDFLNLTMIPTAADCKTTPDNLNENILKISLKTKKSLAAGLTGQVLIPTQSIKTSSNITGGTYLSCYLDNGNINGRRYDYGSDINIDLSQAALIYEITNKGDIDLDGKVASADALLILQGATNVVPLTPAQKERADVNCDAKITSSDALAVLQITTNLKKINDFVNK